MSSSEDLERFYIMNITLKELSESERHLDELLQQSALYLQTYRAIDAMSVLNIALDVIARNDVRWQIKSPVFFNIGNAYIQMGNLLEGIEYFEKSYHCTEDGNRKAAIAGTIASYYYRGGDKDKAIEFADKVLETATEPELKSSSFHIKGVVATIEENYPKAIGLFNKALEYAEISHCLSDMAMIIMDISAVYLKMRMPETALSEIYRAERYVKECRNLDLYTRCAIRRAKLLFIMNRDKEAKALIMALDEQQN